MFWSKPFKLVCVYIRFTGVGIKVSEDKLPDMAEQYTRGGARRFIS